MPAGLKARVSRLGGFKRPFSEHGGWGPRLVQEGEGIIFLGGTIKAYTVAHVENDGDKAFVIRGAVIRTYRCPIPHLPLFHRNQSLYVIS
jgi:hypothetical protein